MFFDGACTKETAGAGVVLVSPQQETVQLSLKMVFQVTNNIAEYEALLLGLHATKDRGTKKLKVFGDADLIIQQVNKTFQAKNPRLRAYRDEVWRIKEFFDFFCISYIPRAQNQLADSLVVSASLFIPPSPPKLVYEIQMKYRPSLPDNVNHWKVFDDDDELNRFLQVIDEFSEMQIDQNNDALLEDPKSQLRNKIGKNSIVQLPTNHIPKGLIPLERLFDHNDVPYKAAQKEDQSAVCKHNIGSPGQPKFINLSTNLSTDQNVKYCKLMRQFSDVFAWEYRTYDKNIIQHEIMLEKDTIPFKQKLRPMNPMLLPLVEKEIKKLLAAKIIVPLRYSKWVANLVVVRKKNGEIRLCVDFRNLNKCSKKDNYPLLKMGHLLQQVSGARVMSFIDGGMNKLAETTRESAS